METLPRPFWLARSSPAEHRCDSRRNACSCTSCVNRTTLRTGPISSHVRETHRLTAYPTPPYRSAKIRSVTHGSGGGLVRQESLGGIPLAPAPLCRQASQRPARRPSCSMTNNWAYALAVEKLAGIEVPERAEYLRVILAELTRLQNHASLIGFLLSDMGAWGTPLIYAFREREKILDLFE